ncbi:MAG: fumarylacetoacetate hydrolase family protein [Alcaligenaceae bacterium]|nr:fumarylacetoacetate hydrolase family protein [Alcaligenaceae bacterium]
MKLISFFHQSGPSFGLVDGDKVFDLGVRMQGVCASLEQAIQSDVLDRFPAMLKGATADYTQDEIVFAPVLPNPPRIFCAGLNYLAHRREGNRPDTEVPAFFLRLPESQVGHLRPMVCPVESDQFDFEGEIAVIIGKGGRRIATEQAFDHVVGTTCYNDGSVRDWQLATSQWLPGKNFPSTGAFGPWMVTADELPPSQTTTLVTRLNGEEMQRTTTDLLTFSIPELISHISAFTALRPGDVIVTGTPGGVGLRRTPPLFMKDGDVVEVEVEGVGVLRNPVVKEKSR